MTSNLERLRDTLGRPEFARLLQRLRARLERGKPLTGSMAFSDATPAERDAINRLLGRAPAPGKSVSVFLDQLEEKLCRAGISPNLREAVEQLAGPIIDRRAEREALEERWEALFAAAGESITARPELADWLKGLRENGLPRRYGIQSAEQLLPQALGVLERLPARGIPLAELAAVTTGDAHALDPDRPLATLVIRAATAFGAERWEDTESRRDAWAALGVLCDELSAPVLVLNLRAADESATSGALRLQADAGEPAYLSTRQLLRARPVFTVETTGPVVFVCENPSVVAAAANRLGPDSFPLASIDGQPRTAARLLLNQLRSAGIRLLYHGDFDWPGLQIANTIIARHQAAPWRMRASDYERAATGALSLSGAAIEASWDKQLRIAMLDLGRVVHEEQVLDELINDLDRRERDPAGAREQLPA
jgi:uncharacterized protein (TIGR02679 family)